MSDFQSNEYITSLYSAILRTHLCEVKNRDLAFFFLLGAASGSRLNLWGWLLGVVVRRYIDFLILLIPTPLVSVLFCSSIPTFCSFFKMFFNVFRSC